MNFGVEIKYYSLNLIDTVVLSKIRAIQISESYGGKLDLDK